VSESLQNATGQTSPSPTSTRRISARTARRWLKINGFSYGDAKKDVYFDGHEREDVVKYGEEVFLKAWKDILAGSLYLKKTAPGRSRLVFSQAKSPSSL
jgi:hypothetical protein